MAEIDNNIEFVSDKAARFVVWALRLYGLAVAVAVAVVLVGTSPRLLF